MSLGEIVIKGTLKPDGTLELDAKPNLPAGRVTVVLRSEASGKSSPPLDDAFFQMMERIWAGQKARGHVPRSKEEIDAELRQLRDDAEAEMQATERFQEECRRAREEAQKNQKGS